MYISLFILYIYIYILTSIYISHTHQFATTNALCYITALQYTAIWC